MDAWLKAKAEELAQAAQQSVDALVIDTNEKTSNLEKTQIRDLKFGQGALGFTLERMHVVSVDRATQAGRLGLEIGDQLLKVDGKDVPDLDACGGDEQEEQRMMDLVEKWLKEMPLPAKLQFKSPTPEPSEADDLDDNEGAFEIGEDAEGALGEGDVEIDEAADAEEENMIALEGEPSSWGENLAPPAPELGVHEVIAELSGAKAGDEQESGDASDAPVDVSAVLADLRHEQGARVQLSLELREARKQNAQLTARLETAKKQHQSQQKKAKELEKQVSALKAENKEILLGQSKQEAESYDMLEEVTRLKQTLEAGGIAASEAMEKRASTAEARVVELQAQLAKLSEEMSALSAKAIAADDRAIASEQQGEALRRQLQGFREAHEAEVELIREEHRLQEKLLQSQIAAQEQRRVELETQATRDLELEREETRKAQQALEKQRSALDAAATEVQAAAVEAAAARREAAEYKVVAEAAARSPSPTDTLEAFDDGFLTAADTGAAPPRTPGATEEVSALHNRIEMLERRCVMLQKKLNARPVIQSSSGFDMEVGSLQRRPSWEPWVVSMAGPRVGDLAVVMYNVPDLALRKFTQQLHKHNLLMWVFYGHILILYTLAASCTAQTTLAEEASPVDEINSRMAKAASTAAGAHVR